MHLAWDYLHMVADNGNVALLELRERIYNTGSADIPADAAPPVLPYQQETVVPQPVPAGEVLHNKVHPNVPAELQTWTEKSVPFYVIT